jgi:hypoxia up-regulated 1
MWNWSTRLFLTEARENLTAEASAGLPSKWTKEELDGLEKTLRDHERWLVEWVEKQKVIRSNEDPVIETTEMKARAKVLEQHLQRLWRRKVPKVKPKRTSTSESATATRSAVDEKETTTTEDGGEGVHEAPVGGDDEQVPLTGRIVDDL